MQFYSLSFNNKTNWLVRVTCLFWLIAKIISYNLWQSNRLFPLVPIANFVTAPAFIHFALFTLSITVLIALLFISSNKWLLISIITLEIGACLFDQNRWQPWEYQYIFTIIIILLNAKSEKNILAVIGFLLASIYFYSGVGKINPIFLKSIWSKLLLENTFGISNAVAHQPFVYKAGYILGFLEIIFSIGLLFKQSQRVAAFLLIVMHIIILAVFGPIGIKYDHIIWPWNITMIAFLWIIYFKNNEGVINFSVFKKGGNLLIFILFGAMPIFSFFGYWDYFLSSSLFSSRPPDMYICIHKNSINPLIKYCDTTQAPCDSNAYFINVRLWAFDEIWVPTYPEERVYKSIKTQLQNKYPNLGATYYMSIYKNGKKIKEELR